MWHLQRSLRSSADVWNRMSWWLAFPWFVQSLKCDHWNNLPALFELTEKNCPSILSCGLTTSAWPPSTNKSKELQETEHSYSRSKPSVTVGEGKINKPLLSFTEMLSSQRTDCSTCLREVDYDPFMPSHVKTKGQLTDDIFSVNYNVTCNTTDLVVLSKEDDETAESKSHLQDNPTSLPVVAWLSSHLTSHFLLTTEWTAVLHNCCLWLKMFKPLHFLA